MDNKDFVHHLSYRPTFEMVRLPLQALSTRMDRRFLVITAKNCALQDLTIFRTETIRIIWALDELHRVDQDLELSQTAQSIHHRGNRVLGVC